MKFIQHNYVFSPLSGGYPPGMYPPGMIGGRGGFRSRYVLYRHMLSLLSTLQSLCTIHDLAPRYRCILGSIVHTCIYVCGFSMPGQS